MKKPPWPNCMLLVAPLLAFNGLFTGLLAEGLHHDEGVSSAILLAEREQQQVLAPVHPPGGV